MNRTPIEWTDYSWNCVTGCLHNCAKTYCYNTKKATSPLNRFGAQFLDAKGVKHAERDWRLRETGATHIAKKGEIYPYGYDPTLYPHRLAEPAKVRKPSRIFVVDTGDLFGAWVPKEWIDSILEVAGNCSQHIFQALTKNPRRYAEFEFPQNVWLGTTVNSDKDKARADSLREAQAKVRFLSIEPLQGPITFSLEGFQWIIVGAQTGKKLTEKEKPKAEWVDRILEQVAGFKIPVFMKDNIGPYYPDKMLKQFPQQ